MDTFIQQSINGLVLGSSATCTLCKVDGRIDYLGKNLEPSSWQRFQANHFFATHPFAAISRD